MRLALSSLGLRVRIPLDSKQADIHSRKSDKMSRKVAKAVMVDTEVEVPAFWVFDIFTEIKLISLIVGNISFFVFLHSSEIAVSETAVSELQI